MKQALIIGSTVVDITVRLPKLPYTGQDMNITSQSMSLGGCAYNVSEALRHFKMPYTLFSPVGVGVYGEFVRRNLDDKKLSFILPTSKLDNGCCYCFVEDSGERTFACYRGAEYQFQKDWFRLLDLSAIDRVYVCGLELEEPTGEAILEFLEEHPELTVYFAPGPRIMSIPPKIMDRMLSLSPTLHLNAKEASEFTRVHLNEGNSESRLELASLHMTASSLMERTKNCVIITLGAGGAYILEVSGSHAHIPARSADQIDTTGAGDAHIGAIMACEMRGMTLSDAVTVANSVSAAVVESNGAGISDKNFSKLSFHFSL